MDQGAVAFLTKPFEGDLLLAEVARALSQTDELLSHPPFARLARTH